MRLDECPHCGTKHVEASQLYQETAGGAAKPTIWWRIVRCHHRECEKLVLVFVEMISGGERIHGHYPAGKTELDSTVTTIPQAIRDEYGEAGKCLSIGCYLSSMTMSRRVLQRCLLFKNHDERQLFDQINAAKAAGTIPTAYHDLADEIREFGNIGAHPKDDKSHLVTAENAKHLLGFVALLIEEFFMIPARLSALRSKRTSSSPGTPP